MLPSNIIKFFWQFLSFSFYCNIDKLFYFEDCHMPKMFKVLVLLFVITLYAWNDVFEFLDEFKPIVGQNERTSITFNTLVNLMKEHYTRDSDKLRKLFSTQMKHLITFFTM